ncbi:MAG: hypothetical protein FWG17_04405 [Desulfovibrionaceae bacterium]|nr:hypothetical protein [Desulfovibrionaceae bacterium]
MPAERKLERFLRSSAKDETALRDALIGKNTMQAVKTIVAEFERRFAGKGRTAHDIAKALLPQGKAVSWVHLDINICELCQRFSMLADMLERQRKFLGEGWEDMPEIQHRQIDFFDKVRLIMRSLPKRKDYKLPEEEADYSSPNDKARGFATCFLCWRSIPRTRQEKKTPLCYVHDLMSTSKEYRRRKNMRERMLEILEELENTVPTLAWVRENSGLHPRDFYLGQIRQLDGHFPSLAEYLYELNPRINSPDDLRRALEHPIPLGKLTDAEKAAWKFHFEDFGAYFELNYERMLLAEAWLRAEAEYQHGGKREKK